MLFKFDDAANKPGIYRIKNALNGRVYIGSTKRLKGRAYAHKHSLANGKHTNTFLQNDWNKCGSSQFVFEVVEVVLEPTILLEREQHWLDQVYDNQQQCYNLNPKTCSNRLGTKNKEPRKRGYNLTPEHKEKQSKSLKEHFSSPEAIEKLRESATKGWADREHPIRVLVNAKTGEEVTWTGPLRGFALERGLNYHGLHQVIRGTSKSSGGWYLKDRPPVYTSQKGTKRGPLTPEHRAKIAGGKFSGLMLVSPGGEEFKVGENLRDLCREHSLRYGSIIRVIRGECMSDNGWSLSLDSYQKVQGGETLNFPEPCRLCILRFSSPRSLASHLIVHHKTTLKNVAKDAKMVGLPVL